MQAAAAKRSLPIYGVQTGEKKIAVSFDAAWGNEETQTLIDILGKYNVKSTFFVVGAWVDKYPDSVRALTAAGHEVDPLPGWRLGREHDPATGYAELRVRPTD